MQSVFARCPMPSCLALSLSVLMIGVVGAVTPASAQQSDEEPDACTVLLGDDAGPAQTAEVAIGDNQITVCYRGTAARGRPVFGHSLAWEDTQWVVQYDQLWNTGAVLRTPVALELAGLRIEPGEYGLYAVPGSFEWLLAVTPGVGDFVSGAHYDGAARESEVGRTLVRASATEGYVEHLSFRGVPTSSSSVDLVLEWERTQVRLPLRLAGSLGALACQFRGDPERLSQRGSPLDSVDVRVGDQVARVCYGAPSARERVVFGGLVPYDDMWRTGANEPTVLHLPFPAEVAGIELDPGDYTILTIPSHDEWVVVINGSTNQWGRVTPTEPGGRSRYDGPVRAQEVGRAIVPSEAMDEHVERFRITAEVTGDHDAELLLEWESTRARIPIRAR